MTENTKTLLQRFIACLFGGFVLALMIGPQEGTLTDFGIAFRQAVAVPRIIFFLLIGVIIFVLITAWPLVVPYLHRPGVVPLGMGLLAVIISQTIMNWYDPLAESSGSGKFNALHKAVDKTPALSPLTVAFFDYLAWTLAGVVLVACGAAIITRIRPIGYIAAAAGIAGAVISYLAHRDVLRVGGGIDHSLGMYMDIIGFLILAGAGVTTVFARTDVADTRGFVRKVAEFRPGLPLAAIGLIYGTLAYTTAGWFGTLTINLSISKASDAFRGTPLGQLATEYLGWLGYLLFGASAVLSVLATVLRNRLLALLAVMVSLVSIVLTFFTLVDMTHTGAQVAPQHGPTWQNLGAGGFAACIALTLFLAGASVPLMRGRAARLAREAEEKDEEYRELPVHAAITQTRTSARARGWLIVALGVALFYPPTLTPTWQNVLVGQVGVYVLLAIGLNVVVGWAGLLDLGYIAFYEIGSYTTAYLTGSLPVKPPSWLHLTPLLTIPFAIGACLIAGVLLGAPTLRLRGDYLAIVTLGFGEIIQLLAINNIGGITGGAIGPNIPHPTLSLFGLHITWGEDSLPYWYLLLVLLVVVIVLFYRLENSRVGRAWAAIREDEMAAQASGVNVTRIKLLAFAIGASTSGLAGVFFASQVGYFDPTLFTLQASILIVAYVVFGGMGSLPGAMLGAAVLTWLPQFLKDQVPQNDRQMWIGALVLLMMIFRPAGLLPARRRQAELEGPLGGAATAETRAVPAAEGL